MSNTVQSQPLTIMALVRRKEGLTHEEYSRHWKDVHAPLVAPWLAKHGIIKYRQFHIDTNTDKIINRNEYYGLFKVIDRVYNFDRIVEVQVPSWETYTKALEDPYYAEVVRPDEQRFFDEKQLVFSLGSDYLGVNEGKALAGVSETAP